MRSERVKRVWSQPPKSNKVFKRMSWKVEKEFFLVMVFCLNLSIHLAISGFPLPGIVGAKTASVEWGWVLGHCRLGSRYFSHHTQGAQGPCTVQRLRSDALLLLHTVCPGAKDSSYLDSSFFLHDMKSLDQGPSFCLQETAL